MSQKNILELSIWWKYTAAYQSQIHVTVALSDRSGGQAEWW